MKNLLLVIIALVNYGCGAKEKLITSAPAFNVAGMDLKSMPHKRVKELFVVVFEKNFTPLEWKEIFDQTTLLSKNKKQLREIEGLDDDASSEVRGKMITDNARLLGSLGQKSLFMMNWSAQDENCRIVLKDSWQLQCKPRNRDNPLNGGLPLSVHPLEWVFPNPVVSTTKIPYLRIKLKKESTEGSAFNYSIELRMKQEHETSTESWLKGDAFPEAGSEFLKADGSLTTSFFPYGYAEMTLGN